MISSDCNRCQLYSGSLYLPCAVHPTGPAPDGCLDFAPNAAAAVEEEDELWFPDSSGWYAGEPVPTPSFTLTIQEQLDLLDSHPLFTGCCPQCGWAWDRSRPPAVQQLVRLLTTNRPARYATVLPSGPFL